MKLLNKKTNKNIVCPKCGSEDWTDFDMETMTSTYQIWCKKEDCKNDLLIPRVDILKTKMVVIVE